VGEWGIRKYILVTYSDGGPVDSSNDWFSAAVDSEGDHSTVGQRPRIRSNSPEGERRTHHDGAWAAVRRRPAV
jgi:hypothetical protein